MVERSRRKREMNDIHITRMLLTTALLAAVAALIAGPSQAMLLDGGGTVATEPQPKPGDPGTIPYLSHGIGVDASVYSGEKRSTGLTGDSARTRVDRTAVAVDNTLDPAMKTAIAANKAAQAAHRATLGQPGTIPYLSHGIGVDESLFSGQQPSVGLNGDSPVTRGEMPRSSATQAVSSTDDLDWTWVGFGGGAALLAAAIGGFYLGTRHRGRIALP
jgi:hypothetical protein